MGETIDVRGRSCPEPVIEVRNALSKKESGQFTVLVSSAVARDNVRRAAGGMGWKVEVEEMEDGFQLNVSR